MLWIFENCETSTYVTNDPADTTKIHNSMPNQPSPSKFGQKVVRGPLYLRAKYEGHPIVRYRAMIFFKLRNVNLRYEWPSWYNKRLKLYLSLTEINDMKMNSISNVHFSNFSSFAYQFLMISGLTSIQFNLIYLTINSFTIDSIPILGQ